MSTYRQSPYSVCSSILVSTRAVLIYPPKIKKQKSRPTVQRFCEEQGSLLFNS
ncbi:MAG: hypothetical protein J6U86_04020 [Clostridia bacterium]|nr:hypothetical protein [Clostridia bacterium]